MSLLDAVAAVRENARQMHHAGVAGRQVARELSSAMDELTRGCVGAAAEELGANLEGQIWAVVAQGGWGRGELSPGSDLDLLLLYRRRSEAIEKLARGLFYPLWDAQLEIGHGVRTVAQCLSVSTLDLASRTALLDTRLIAGQPVLAEELRRGLLKQLRRGQGEGFFRALAAERDERHAGFRPESCLLEPNLKDGPGGLRDLHGVGWALRVRAEVQAAERRTSDETSLAEAPEVAEAADFLTRLRNHLHFISGRKTDALQLKYQAASAGFLGFPTEAALREAVCAHMATIRAATDALWPTLGRARGWR